MGQHLIIIKLITWSYLSSWAPDSDYNEDDGDNDPHNVYQAIGKSGLKRRCKALVPKQALNLTHFFHRISAGEKTNIMVMKIVQK